MSATAPLKSLSITAFRGSSTPFTLPFEKDRKLTLVYGENGSGKTTICDAFELLAHGRVSSLDGYGLGKGLEKYWPTAGECPKSGVNSSRSLLLYSTWFSRSLQVPSMLHSCSIVQ